MEHDPSTWDKHCDGAISTRRLRDKEQFRAAVAPPVQAPLDEVFGVGGWKEGRSVRVLVTPPGRHPSWSVPTGFHTDFGLDRAACGRNAPLGRRLSRRARRHADRTPLNAFARKQGEWLRQLVNDDDTDPARTDRCFDGVEIDGVPVRVVELIGRAGDVVVTHAYTLHSSSPNTSSRMRLMLSTGIGVHS